MTYPIRPLRSLSAGSAKGAYTLSQSPLAPCAACGLPSSGHWSVHRDGFCEGPIVDICDACGESDSVTLNQIWAAIAERKKNVS